MISKPIILSAVAIAAVAFVFAAAPIVTDVMQAHAQFLGQLRSMRGGINVVAASNQRQSCTIAGPTSCVATATNTATNTGGGVGSGSGINVAAASNQEQGCTSAGGTSSITGSCTATATNTATNTGGAIR